MKLHLKNCLVPQVLVENPAEASRGNQGQLGPCSARKAFQPKSGQVGHSWRWGRGRLEKGWRDRDYNKPPRWLDITVGFKGKDFSGLRLRLDKQRLQISDQQGVCGMVKKTWG